MLDPRVAKESLGVLMFADRLAKEYHGGTPLRGLPNDRQFALAIKAKDRLNHYKETHS